jgi:hypothetical protein
LVTTEPGLEGHAIGGAYSGQRIKQDLPGDFCRPNPLPIKLRRPLQLEAVLGKHKEGLGTAALVLLSLVTQLREYNGSPSSVIVENEPQNHGLLAAKLAQSIGLTREIQ